MGIHQCANIQQIRRTGGPGSILLSERDADNVYGILSLGSKVTIVGSRAPTAGSQAPTAGSQGTFFYAGGMQH